MLTNDSDADGEVLTVAGSTAWPLASAPRSPAGAQRDPERDGSWTYVPNGASDSLEVGETGTDSFTYRACDGDGLFNSATVTITVNGANDAPLAVNDTARPTRTRPRVGRRAAR